MLVPGSAELATVPPRLAVRDFAEVRFADLLADLGIHAERTGLPGVQDKASATMLNLPVATGGARFILKLDPPESPHLVENELFFLRAARASALPVAAAQPVHDELGVPGLLIERFDRIRAADHDAQRLRSLAVEDACQVLGRPAADKYIVGTEAALGALVNVCQAPLPAARILLAQLVFAYITGNGDAHAKNFSVLQGINGEWRPSPAYDVPSSQPYGQHNGAVDRRACVG